MRYGYFNDQRRGYDVIIWPDPPLPWINYLGCATYFGIISNEDDQSFLWFGFRSLTAASDEVFRKAEMPLFVGRCG